jgi:hypothetical protein
MWGAVSSGTKESIAVDSREAPIESRWQRPIGRIIFLWIPIVGLFFVANIGIEHYWTPALNLFDALRQYMPGDPELSTLDAQEGAATILAQVVTPTLGLAYYGCLLILTIPLARPALRTFKASVDRELCIRALWIFALLMVLVFSVMVESAGRSFMRFSVDPFNVETGWNYRRRLIPALAYLLQLKGIWYHVFAHSLAALLILVVLVWARRAGMRMSTWQGVCIFSSGWVVYQMQFPGYADAAVYIILLSSLIVPMSTYGRAVCVALMLATHESIGLVTSLPAIVFVFPRREWGTHLAVIVLYFLTWLANFGFDPSQAMEAQLRIAGSTPLEHLRANPLLLPLAAVCAYKALWAFPAFAVVDFLRKRRIRDAAFVVTAIALPVGLVFLAVDASRLIGAGYLGVLVGTVHAAERWPRRRFNAVLIANLLLPSVQVFTHVGPQVSSGLYRLYTGFLLFLFH